jgi:hypothetical protein
MGNCFREIQADITGNLQRSFNFQETNQETNQETKGKEGRLNENLCETQVCQGLRLANREGEIEFYPQVIHKLSTKPVIPDKVMLDVQ